MALAVIAVGTTTMLTTLAALSHSRRANSRARPPGNVGKKSGVGPRLWWMSLRGPLGKDLKGPQAPLSALAHSTTRVWRLFAKL